MLAKLATRPDQVAGSPETTATRAEKLVVEFDTAYTAFVENIDRLPSESQMLALQAVDTKLAAMVAAKEPALWIPWACREDIRWREVRALAETALDAFDWPPDDAQATRN